MFQNPEADADRRTLTGPATQPRPASTRSASALFHTVNPRLLAPNGSSVPEAVLLAPGRSLGNEDRSTESIPGSPLVPKRHWIPEATVATIDEWAADATRSDVVDRLDLVDRAAIRLI
jgi:hypothetical protein